jgi:hypothetical protein
MATKNEILTKVLTALKTARAELRSFFERTIAAAEAGTPKAFAKARELTAKAETVPPKAFAKARELTAKLDEGLSKTLDSAEAKLVKLAANENQTPKAA